MEHGDIYRGKTRGRKGDNNTLNIISIIHVLTLQLHVSPSTMYASLNFYVLKELTQVSIDSSPPFPYIDPMCSNIHMN